MEITLAPDQEQIVKRLMASGKHDNPAEAVVEALTILEDEYDLELMMPKAVVQAEIQKGIDQSERGEGKPWNLEEFLTSARARAEDRRAEKAHA
jgi:Arc/MetJ-type ribon-helix-helix transcriptional regulator